MTKTNDIRFSKQRYDRYDSLGKNVSQEWMEQFGFVDIQENENEQKGKFQEIWDIKGYTPNKHIEFRIETEIKDDWGTRWQEDTWDGKEYPFKWPSMHFPYRKRDKAQVHATHHMIVGGDEKRFFLIPRQTIITSPVIEKRCRNRKGLEPFFEVSLPAAKSMWFEKNEKGRWKKWRM